MHSKTNRPAVFFPNVSEKYQNLNGSFRLFLENHIVVAEGYSFMAPALQSQNLFS